MNSLGRKKSLTFILFSFGLLCLFSACAHKVPLQNCVSGSPYGFFSGLWHGFIAPFTFVVSIFDREVAMYAVHNSGLWYDFGFVLGAGILFGSGGKASK